MRYPALLLLFCALPCHAQELVARAETPAKIEAPKPKVIEKRIGGKTFWVSMSVLGASEVADAVTTRRLLDDGGHENNALLLGRHPSPGRQAAVNAALFAGELTVFYFAERSRHPWIRWTGRVLVGGSIVVHSQLAACNASLLNRQSCPLL